MPFPSPLLEVSVPTGAEVCFTRKKTQMQNLQHNAINPNADKAYVLERNCRANYASECPWAREISYEQYRENWLTDPAQAEGGFWKALLESMKDPRTIAEIIKTQSGEIVGWLWVAFHGENESFIWADAQSIYIEEKFRRKGIAEYLTE